MKGFSVLSFQIDDDTNARLRAAATAAGDRSISSLLREMIRRALDEQSGPARLRKREAVE
jgi:Ribbon-helix-helix protein, copG family